MDQEFLLNLVIRIPPVLLALTVHEFMHAYAAFRCGDPTARDLGRVTLNPLAHLDPLGTLCLMFGPIGWAKPVPVNPYNFRRPRRDDIVVSLAGVASNFVLAVTFCATFRLMSLSQVQIATKLHAVLVLMMFLGVVVNFGLCFFNLLPIAPLDGHHVVRELLPYPARERFMEFSRYGPLILLGLVVINRGAGLRFLNVPIDFFMGLFAGESIEQYAGQAYLILGG